MATLEKILEERLSKHINSVRQTLSQEDMSPEDIEELLDNIYHHAISTARTYAEDHDINEAVEKTMATLEAPASYASQQEKQERGSDSKFNFQSKNILGGLSIIFMISGLVVGIILSDSRLFDTPYSGTVFIFGLLISLGTGLAALPNIFARLGALCSAFLLLFLITHFLWTNVL